MTVGERIKQRRKELGVPSQILAKKLGVSPSTLYRYETSGIEKIPMQIMEKLCKELSTTPAQLMGNDSRSDEAALPASFSSPTEAMEFIIKMPMLAAYGGYDPESMSEEEIVNFANDILEQMKLVSFKYAR